MRRVWIVFQAQLGLIAIAIIDLMTGATNAQLAGVAVGAMAGILAGFRLNGPPPEVPGPAGG